MAITKDQIINAAESLKAEGINPSMSAVRERLGGGSFATISPVLREWRESQEQRATVAIEMPAEAKAALDRAGIDIWRIVTGLATEKLAKVQAEADEAVKSATAERDEALAEIERLEASLEKANSELLEKSEVEEKAKQLDMQVHKLQISLDIAVKTNDELKEEIKQLRQTNEEKSRELGKMAAILEQNEQLRQKIDELTSKS